MLHCVYFSRLLDGTQHTCSAMLHLYSPNNNHPNLKPDLRHCLSLYSRQVTDEFVVFSDLNLSCVPQHGEPICRRTRASPPAARPRFGPSA